MLKRLFIALCLSVLSLMPINAAQLNGNNPYVDLSTPSFSNVIPYDASGGRAAVLILPIVDGTTTTYIVPSSSNGVLNVSLNQSNLNWVWYSTTIIAVNVPQTFTFGASRKVGSVDIVPLGGNVGYWIDGTSDTIINGYPITIPFYPYTKTNFKIGVSSLAAGTSAQIRIYGGE